jgi:hypothetical protein
MRHFIKSILVLIGLVPSLTHSQTVAVELEKMNVLYVGVENPIRIAIENYPCDKIVVKTTKGIIKTTSDHCHYYYKTDSCWTFNEQIFVGINEGNITKWLDTLDYRIKKTPTPRILIAGHYRGLIEKKDFINSVILAHLEGFDFNGYAKVIKYSYEIWRQDSIIKKETDLQGNKFSTSLNSEIAKAKQGDRYIFFDVFAETTTDKCLREMDSAEFEIK